MLEMLEHEPEELIGTINLKIIISANEKKDTIEIPIEMAKEISAYLQMFRMFNALIG